MRKPRIVLLAATIAAAAAALPSVATADVAHVVTPGETLSSIATSDGLSESALAAANGLAPDAELIIGTLIEIPPQTAGASVTPGMPEVTAPASTSSTYVVQRGDTLSSIAASIGTNVATLAAANGLNPAGPLWAGTTLTLPTSGSQPATVSDTTEQSLTPAASGPDPTDVSVDAPTLSEIAEQYGVSPAFAEAVAWQESGWDNGVVSATGAVGVMQLEPDTWTWLEHNLADDTLDPVSVTDNIRGGVMLLKDLIDRTGSESSAAAAYYQGLGSLERYGMFGATKEYVADVMALTARYGG